MTGIGRGLMCAAALAAAGHSPPTRAGAVPLEELARALGLEHRRDAATDRQILSAPGVQVVAAPGLSTILFNDRPVRFSRPVAVEEGRLVVPDEIAAWLTAHVAPAAAVPQKPAPALAGCRVAIDPGHGGKFAGAVGPNGLTEKEVALDVARRASALLGERGATVVLTRAADAHLSEDWRTDLTLRPRAAAGSDLLVSIHFNSSPDPAACGFEVYVHRGAGAPELRLASELRRALRAAGGGPDRGTKAKDFIVVREAPCPAVLVEMEFLSNAEREAWLRTSEARARLAAAVADGIAAWWSRGR
jgi:N-acetylmuramoyl-L-alanine amidase